MHEPYPLPSLPWQTAEARGPGRHGGRPEHRGFYQFLHRPGHGIFGSFAADRAGNHDCRAHSQGNPGPPWFSALRRLGILDAFPQQRHFVRRREPTHPIGHADRLLADGRAVYSGRAFHWLAPAGQRQAAGHPEAAAGLGQHLDRGGARRRNHAGGGPYHRRGPRGRRSRGPDYLRRRRPDDYELPRIPDGPISQR